MAVGLTVSNTVTVDVQLSVLLLGSVAVRVTVLTPVFEQVNESGVALSVTEQLSLLPLSTSAATMLAFPEPSK